MKKFWGICNNDKYTVGCNGASIYIYDNNGKQLQVFKDAPYTYRAKFKPHTHILAAKSTAGFLLIYDLDELKLLNKIKTAQIGSQDDGFVFSNDGNYLYNIERSVYFTNTRLSIYNMKDYSVIKKLFENDEKIVLKNLEFDQNNTCYLLGFMRDDVGVFDYGFIAKLVSNNLKDIKILDKDKYEYLSAFKNWEDHGFSNKALEWSSKLKNIEAIEKTTIIDTYNDLENKSKSIFSKLFKK
ncbi:YncE family protein [Clostridium sp. AUH-JLR23]|uniref:YncE family protein n=1 Tax=Clostridium sp. AUH-JLR23 TaxID=1505062 RepID=UPI0035683092